MGLFFTILYIFAAYMTPGMVFGELALYRIQIVIVLLAVLFSVNAMGESGLSRMPQTPAIIGISITVAISLVVNGLGMGSAAALLDFIPTSIVFFLIVLNCTKKVHLQILIAVLFIFAAFTIYQGWSATASGNFDSPFVLGMRNNQKETFFRIRALGFLSDPNDLAQFLVCLMPCLFFFWKKGSTAGNLFLVYLPCAVLLTGMFLTHSRGIMVSLLAVSIVLGRRKYGLLPSIVAGAVLFAGLSAAGMSGGRDVNADAGADRMEAWSTGLELIKWHPVFGVGFQRFTEYFYITAHNTVVVCAAEIGFVGLFFWMLCIVPSLRDVVVASPQLKKKKETDSELDAERFAYLKTTAGFSPQPLVQLSGANAMVAEPARIETFMAGAGAWTPAPQSGPSAQTMQFATAAAPGFGGAIEDEDPNPPEEYQRMARLMVISFTGFLTAAWFLSRPYTMTVYVLCGISAAICKMARSRGAAPDMWPLGTAAKRSFQTAIGFIIAVYVIIRVQHFFGL